MKQQFWRVSFKCPDCEVLHVQVLGRRDAIDFTNSLTANGVMQVLLQEEVTAKMDEMDVNERATLDPAYAKVLMDHFKRMGRG